MSEDFRAYVWSLYVGEVTADAFFAATREHWRTLAKHMLRRWRAPSWLDPEEVEQELMLGAFEIVWKFEDRGQPDLKEALRRYVVWNAYDKAKKRLHRARNAKRRADHAPSRVDLPASALSSDPDWDPFHEQLAVVDAEQEDEAERGESLRAVLEACRDEAERAILRSLVEHGDFIAAAENIYATPSARALCRVTSPADAGRKVVAVCDRLAERLGMEPAA